MPHQIGDLKVTEPLYNTRRTRLARLIQLNAPRVILLREAELFLQCFRREPWYSRLRKRIVLRIPHRLMLLSPSYRQQEREFMGWLAQEGD